MSERDDATEKEENKKKKPKNGQKGNLSYRSTRKKTMKTSGANEISRHVRIASSKGRRAGESEGGAFRRWGLQDLWGAKASIAGGGLLTAVTKVSKT